MRFDGCWIALALAVSLAGCDKGASGGDDSEQADDTDKKEKKKSAILKKKIADLTYEDMVQAGTDLGWGAKPSSSRSKGANETFIVSGSEEHPDGTDSPDGKKRIRMSIGLFLEKDAATAESQKTRSEKDGDVAVVEGTRVLTASYRTAKGADSKKAQEILDRLLGK